MVPIAAARSTEQKSWFSGPLLKRIEWLIPLGVGLVCFAITEFMHRLLVPDIGGQKERWLAEAVSALVVGGLVAKLTAVLHRQHQIMQARVQIMSEMNHHVRNALMAISASADLAENQECNRVILESVQRIDWALREILPRSQPLPQAEQTRLMFSMSGTPGAFSRANKKLGMNPGIGERR
jgi:signal transduction histidine kinase